MSNFVNFLDIIYPVGSIYITTNDISPADSIGGTWFKIEDCLLAAAGDTYNTIRGYSGNDMIAVVALPNHQHKVSAYSPSKSYGTQLGFGLPMLLAVSIGHYCHKVLTLLLAMVGSYGLVIYGELMKTVCLLILNRSISLIIIL